MTEARFSIGIWREALQPFAWVDLEVNNYLRIHTDLRKTSLSHFLAGIVGGNAKGCCLKAEGEVAAGDTRERLMCIRCSSAMQLKEENAEQVRCNACGKTYPIKDRIICILPEELEAEIP